MKTIRVLFEKKKGKPFSTFTSRSLQFHGKVHLVEGWSTAPRAIATRGRCHAHCFPTEHFSQLLPQITMNSLLSVNDWIINTTKLLYDGKFFLCPVIIPRLTSSLQHGTLPGTLHYFVDVRNPSKRSFHFLTFLTPLNN